MSKMSFHSTQLKCFLITLNFNTLSVRSISANDTTGVYSDRFNVDKMLFDNSNLQRKLKQFKRFIYFIPI